MDRIEISLLVVAGLALGVVLGFYFSAPDFIEVDYCLMSQEIRPVESVYYKSCENCLVMELVALDRLAALDSCNPVLRDSPRYNPTFLFFAYENTTRQDLGRFVTVRYLKDDDGRAGLVRGVFNAEGYPPAYGATLPQTPAPLE